MCIALSTLSALCFKNQFFWIQEANNQDDDPLKKIQGQKIVKCRVCKGDHWTTKCPYKDSLQPLQQKEQDEKGLSLFL